MTRSLPARASLGFRLSSGGLLPTFVYLPLGPQPTWNTFLPDGLLLRPRTSQTERNLEFLSPVLLFFFGDPVRRSEQGFGDPRVIFELRRVRICQFPSSSIAPFFFHGFP